MGHMKKFECPYCRRRLDADADIAGMEAMCPACRHPLLIPANVKTLLVRGTRQKMIALTVFLSIPLAVLLISLSLVTTGAILEGVAWVTERFVVKVSSWPNSATQLFALTAKALTALAFVLPTVGYVGAWATQILSYFVRRERGRQTWLVQVAGTVSVALALIFLASAVTCLVRQLPYTLSKASQLISFVFYWLVGVLSIYFWWADDGYGETLTATENTR